MILPDYLRAVLACIGAVVLVLAAVVALSIAIVAALDRLEAWRRRAAQAREGQ